MSSLTQPLNLADLIRDKVRAEIVSTIPDEQVNTLIKKEWESYFLSPSLDSWKTYSDEDRLSPFQREIRKCVRESLTTKIKEAIDKEMLYFTQSTWENQAKSAVSSMIRQYSQDVLEGLTRDIANRAVMNLRNNGY